MSNPLRESLSEGLCRSSLEEAQAYFDQAQAQREEKQRTKHLVKVQRSWKTAKRVVKRGDAKAEKALKVFLEAYANHPLGHPLAEEAHSFFAEAQAKYEAKRAAKHLAKVKREWAKLTPI